MRKICESNSYSYPLTKKELLREVGIETARMSYPGSMSRGPTQVVKAGTKVKLEKHFSTDFPIMEIRDKASEIAKIYDKWHDQQTQNIGLLLKQEGCLGNKSNDEYAIGAKFLNTFMHQLMKYEWAHPLWQKLQLPLDARVFKSFRHIGRTSLAIRKINERIKKKTAYSISREDYKFIQENLWEYIKELNNRPRSEFKITSRIELNYLWLFE